MKAAGEPSGRRKWLAAGAVILIVVALQGFIHWRTLPPEPAVAFPKTLRDIPP